MKKTINRYEFIEGMQSYYDGNGFSHEGLSYLLDYLEEYEQETGEEMEFDAVALHCQFSEITVNDFINDYLLDNEIEKLKNDLKVEDIEDITSIDFMNYYNNNFNSYVVIACVDGNTIIVDISAI